MALSKPFRSKALRGRAEAKPVRELTADDRAGLAKDRRATLNHLLFPGPAREFETHRQTFGDTTAFARVVDAALPGVVALRTDGAWTLTPTP